MRHGDFFRHPLGGDPLMFCGYSYASPHKVWCIRYWGSAQFGTLYLCDAVLLQERMARPALAVPDFADKFRSVCEDAQAA